MWIESVIKILKNRRLLIISVDMLIAYFCVIFEYVLQIGIKDFLVNPLDEEFILLPLRIPTFYAVIIIAPVSIWVSKFIFDLLCLFSRQFILVKLESIRNIIRKNHVAQHLKLKRFSLAYSVKTLKNIIYTSSVFLFSFVYTSFLSFFLTCASDFLIIKIISVISFIALYLMAFIVVIRNYFTAISVSDVLNSTKTDGYQALRDIFR